VPEITISWAETIKTLPWASYATRALAVALVWLVIWILVRHLSRWIASLDEHLENVEIDRREMQVLDRVLDYILVIIGTVITLSLLGISELLYSALTAAGVISVIIGFAVKDVAANFISGIFILVDQPFVIGDFIEIGSYSGTVSKISLRSTQLVTFDGPVVTIPNSKMATDPTVNYSIAAMRLVEVKVSVPKDGDLGPAIRALQDVGQAESRLVSDKGITILVQNIGEYAVDLLLRCFAPNDSWVQVQSDLRQRVIEEFQERGVELAIPAYKNLQPM
jgi:small-conductance mechanosensitive channel